MAVLAIFTYHIAAAKIAKPKARVRIIFIWPLLGSLVLKLPGGDIREQGEREVPVGTLIRAGWEPPLVLEHYPKDQATNQADSFLSLLQSFIISPSVLTN